MNAFELSGRLDEEAERLTALAKDVEEAREEFEEDSVPRIAMLSACEHLDAAAGELVSARQQMASVLGETTREALLKLRETKDTDAFLRTVVGRVATAAVTSAPPEEAGAGSKDEDKSKGEGKQEE
jgi:hypothetical protein